MSAESQPTAAVHREALPRCTFEIFWLALIGLLCLFCRLSDWEKVFTEHGVCFFDTDTYTRMERVRQVEQSGGWPVRFHAFENAPWGIVSHATSPLDYTILLLSLPLRFFLEPQDARDLAGAWVSPLIGLAGLICLFFLLRGEPGRWWALIAYCVLPALSWAQNLGRPDHQSLLTALLTVALAIEWRILRASDGEGFLKISAGVVWGSALWVSLFEPLIFVVLCFALSFLGRSHWLRRGWHFYIPFVVLLISRFVVDPWPTLPPASDAGWLRNWSLVVGELRPSSTQEMIYWTGLWLPAVVISSGCAMSCKPLRSTAIYTIVFAAICGLLTFWQIRWSAYLAVVLAVPGMLIFFREGYNARKVVLTVLFYVPVLMYYVNYHLRWKQPSEGFVELKKAAELIAQEPATILAPWWLSPALGYFSGAKYVASSSHQSIQGIVDVSEFLLTPHWEMAREILLERNVGWVVSADPARMFSQSQAIAHGLRVVEDEKVLWRDMSYRVALGTRLARGLSPAPAELKLVAVLGEYRVYRFLPRNGGSVSD